MKLNIDDFLSTLKEEQRNQKLEKLLDFFREGKYVRVSEYFYYLHHFAPMKTIIVHEDKYLPVDNNNHTGADTILIPKFGRVFSVPSPSVVGDYGYGSQLDTIVGFWTTSFVLGKSSNKDDFIPL